MRIFNTLPPHRFSPRATSLVAALLLAFAAASEGYAQTTAPISSQSWNFKGYGDRTGRLLPGQITLESKDGHFYFQMMIPSPSICSRSTLKATVEKNETTTTITPVPLMPDCLARYVIKNDGTGGVRETKVGDAWVADGLDRDLTPKR